MRNRKINRFNSSCYMW